MTTLENYKVDNLPDYSKCAIVGKRGTGGTFLCKNLVQNQLRNKNISHTYIICHAQILLHWKDKLNTQNISYHTIINIDLLNEIKLKINSGEKIIIVLDDFIIKKNQYEDIFKLKAFVFTTYQIINFIPINYTNIIFFMYENNDTHVKKIYHTVTKYYIDVPKYDDFVKIFFTSTQNYSALVVDGYSFRLYRTNANEINISPKPTKDYIIESVDNILKRFQKNVKLVIGFEILI
uniref:Putative ATPase n=1 Tax=Borely moumouvirus TaxID=2712067 RepID=A0A6G6ADC5_9VIRU